MRAPLLTLALIAAFSTAAVHAQTQPKQPAKPAAKAPAKPDAAPAKARPKLMTRDELRECLARREANVTESKAIEAEDKELLTHADAVKADKAAFENEQKDFVAAQTVLVADNEALRKRGEELSKTIGDMKPAKQKEVKADYDKAAAELSARVDAHNARLKALKAREEALMQKIDDFNKRQSEASTRVDKLGELEDKWRAECGNRPYDERDEDAIKKEMAAKKAAGQ